MFDVTKKKKQELPLIRVPGCNELTPADRELLNSLEPGAEKNVLEVVYVNGRFQPVEKKEIHIELGALSDKDVISSSDFAEEIFIFECTPPIIQDEGN